jgi:hypothetical protein
MVLPADIANPLRDAIAGSGLGGDSYNFTIHAMDSRDVARLFKDQGRAIVDSLNNQARMFAFNARHWTR